MTSVPVMSTPSGSRESQTVPCSMPKTTASACSGGSPRVTMRLAEGAAPPEDAVSVPSPSVAGGRRALHLGDQDAVQDDVRGHRLVQRDVHADGVAGREPAADGALRLEQDA